MYAWGGGWGGGVGVSHWVEVCRSIFTSVPVKDKFAVSQSPHLAPLLLPPQVPILPVHTDMGSLCVGSTEWASTFTNLYCIHLFLLVLLV